VTRCLAQYSAAGTCTSSTAQPAHWHQVHDLLLLRNTDNNRIARATGATIVHRPEEIRESDIGTRAGLFDVRKIGDEFFTFIVDCEVGALFAVDGLTLAADPDISTGMQLYGQVLTALLFSSHLQVGYYVASHLL
jgi:hypothetical protein